MCPVSSTGCQPAYQCDFPSSHPPSWSTFGVCWKKSLKCNKLGRPERHSRRGITDESSCRSPPPPPLPYFSAPFFHARGLPCQDAQDGQDAQAHPLDEKCIKLISLDFPACTLFILLDGGGDVARVGVGVQCPDGWVFYFSIRFPFCPSVLLVPSAAAATPGRIHFALLQNPHEPGRQAGGQTGSFPHATPSSFIYLFFFLVRLWG